MYNNPEKVASWPYTSELQNTQDNTFTFFSQKATVHSHSKHIT